MSDIDVNFSELSYPACNNYDWLDAFDEGELATFVTELATNEEHDNVQWIICEWQQLAYAPIIELTDLREDLSKKNDLSNYLDSVIQNCKWLTTLSKEQLKNICIEVIDKAKTLTPVDWDNYRLKLKNGNG